MNSRLIARPVLLKYWTEPSQKGKVYILSVANPGINALGFANLSLSGDASPKGPLPIALEALWPEAFTWK